MKGFKALKDGKELLSGSKTVFDSPYCKVRLDDVRHYLKSSKGERWVLDQSVASTEI
jgi:hypothetical protein